MSVSSDSAPRLLAPMAAMLREHSGGRLTLSTTAMRSLLDGIASRIDESREISRYMIGLLVFLGLLGTFWGLIETVKSISDVIGSLSAATDRKRAGEGQRVQARVTSGGTRISTKKTHK